MVPAAFNLPSRQGARAGVPTKVMNYLGMSVVLTPFQPRALARGMVCNDQIHTGVGNLLATVRMVILLVPLSAWTKSK